MKRTGAAWMAAFLLTLMPVGATVVPRLGLEDLEAGAPLVVRARIGASWTAWDAKHMFLWTHYRVEVLDIWKGAPPAGGLVVSEPGGELEGVRMSLPGAVAYTEGEEVVLFLEQTPIGYWRVRGYQQGKFEVVREAGEPRVRTNLAGAVLVDPPGKTAATRTTAIDGVDRMGLVQFKALVRALASKPVGGAR